MTSLYTKAFLLGMVVSTSLANAQSFGVQRQGKVTPPSGAAPEIDGPAGIAAVALLACAGIMAYRRFRK